MIEPMEYAKVASTENHDGDDDEINDNDNNLMRTRRRDCVVVAVMKFSFIIIMMFGLLRLLLVYVVQPSFVPSTETTLPNKDTTFSPQQYGDNDNDNNSKQDSSLGSLPMLNHSTEGTNGNYSTALLQRTLHQCQTNVSERCFMFVLKDSGIGNVLLNMFAIGLFLRERRGYTTMLVDEVMYEGYQRGAVPVLSGYFTPQFVVVDTIAQRDLVKPLLPTGFSLDLWDTLEGQDRRRYKDLVKHNEDHATVVVASRQMFHNNAVRHFESNDLYEKLVPTMCENIQFNDVAWQSILATRRRYYGDNLPTNLQHDPSVSVAFHVRRTDKLIAEAAAIPALEYVDQFLRVLRTTNASDVTTCFLATDDVATVHREMRQALAMRDLRCRLVYTPVTQSRTIKDRYQPDGALTFFTELSVLLEATYFIGTFSSNVGGLAAVLRACPGRYDLHQHYADSYSVDLPEWNF